MPNYHDYFSQLPDEMVMKILLLLDYDSMLSARICCVRFEILLTGIFEKRSMFTLERWKGFQLTRDLPAYNWVFKTNKKFKNLCFNEFNFNLADISDIDEFLNLHGEHVVRLHLIYCKANKVILNKILNKTVNMKYFKLGLSRDIDGVKIINKLYDRCVEITFISSTDIDKNEIETISTDRKTTIEELNLEFVKCRETNSFNRQFRDSGVYKLIKLIHPNLKRFELFSTNGDENILQHLSELNLNLENFKIYFNDVIDDWCMLNITNQMKNLQKLDINGTRFSNENANVIYDNLSELRSLTFRECDILCNDGIINVTKLKKLEEFTLNTCQNITNHGIVQGIASKLNPTLKRIELYERFSNDTLIAIVNNLPNLEVLYIFTVLFFSTHLIPLVFERLTNLKEFSINAANQEVEGDIDMFEAHEVEKNLPEPKLLNPNIKISQLSKLTLLQIYGFETIPGVSLLDIAQIPKLRHLTLHNYEDFAKDKIINLLTGLKYLRKLDLRDIDDRCLIENETDKLDIRAAKNPKTEFIFNYNPF